MKNWLLIIMLLSLWGLADTAGAAAYRELRSLDEGDLIYLRHGIQDPSIPYVLWGKDRRLSWDDFKGEVPEDGHELDAQSAVEIYLRWRCQGGRFTYTVSPVFNQAESWVVPDRKSNDRLIHEQGYFDLGKVYAKKLEMALSMELAKFMPVCILPMEHTPEEMARVGELLRKMDPCGDPVKWRETVERLAEANEKAFHAEQKRYDEETQYGQNKVKQKEWEEKIKKELKK